MNSRKWLNFINDDGSEDVEYNPNLSLLTESEFQDLPNYSNVLSEAEDSLIEKKKKKKKKKKDACYRKVKSRYKVWPSAYASGALVKCRKVGAANWGNSKTNEEIEQELELDTEFLKEIEDMLDEKKSKLTAKPASEKSLHDWFGRKGAKGKKKGWVDCNAPDGDGGYKSCGKSSGEKRKRYPACRPTPGACKKMKGSKGKSWGKKDAKRKGKKK